MIDLSKAGSKTASRSSSNGTVFVQMALAAPETAEAQMACAIPTLGKGPGDSSSERADSPAQRRQRMPLER